MMVMAAASVVVSGCVTVSPDQPAKLRAPTALPPGQSPVPLLQQRPNRQTVMTTASPAPQSGSSAASRPDRPTAHGAAGSGNPPETAPRHDGHGRHGASGHIGGHAVPRMGSDVCALGQAYGRWGLDSDATQICQQVYGK